MQATAGATRTHSSSRARSPRCDLRYVSSTCAGTRWAKRYAFAVLSHTCRTTILSIYTAVSRHCRATRRSLTAAAPPAIRRHVRLCSPLLRRLATWSICLSGYGAARRSTRMGTGSRRCSMTRTTCTRDHRPNLFIITKILHYHSFIITINLLIITRAGHDDTQVASLRSLMRDGPTRPREGRTLAQATRRYALRRRPQGRDQAVEGERWRDGRPLRDRYTCDGTTVM